MTEQTQDKTRQDNTSIRQDKYRDGYWSGSDADIHRIDDDETTPSLSCSTVQCVKGLGLNKTKIRRQNNKSKNLDVFFNLKLLVEMPCKFFPFVRHTKFGDFFPLHIIQNELHLHLTHRSKGKGDSNHVKKRRIGERMVREE